jgi:hypothetical protein
MTRKTARIWAVAALCCCFILGTATAGQAVNWKAVTVLQVSFLQYTDGTTRLCLTVSGEDLSVTNVYYIGPDATSENRAFQMALTAISSGLQMVIDLQTTSYQGVTFYTTNSVVLQNVPVQ